MARCSPATRKRRAKSRASSRKFNKRDPKTQRAASKRYYQKHRTAILAAKKAARKSGKSGGGGKKVGRPRKSC